ncbi:DUF4276 family protein [Hymenobacter sp. ASUV-10]|uniref:DUF4276 family protein n=1 Tax=Hymenobacter aranciens TaxID=3063996 RepID=A0ABT9BHA2_9BACT|nr:DUF4276 family protein [Hymenobacter sp. ASUV-10]MDO7877621.1 DUF4276 family protein [Hymenobacter sp. ASUV-10]
MHHLLVWVEGDGDQAAAPLLLKKLLKRAQRFDWNVPQPIKVGEMPKLRKVLPKRAAEVGIKARAGVCHAVLVLLDLDDAQACPVTEAQGLATTLATYRLPVPVAVVLARREYEEWLVASLPTIAPHTPLLPDSLRRDYPAEGKRDVKGWLQTHMEVAYKPPLHQPEFTRHLDPALASAECRSFRRLETALAWLLTLAAAPPATQQGAVSPH